MRHLHLTILTLALAILIAAPALAAPNADAPNASATAEISVAQPACDQVAPAGGATDAMLPGAELLTETAWGGVCDPNRQCVTDADCGQFGYCAVYRLCICNG
ncbi:MAG: hypothetical protein SX243_17100 [Acidobacteriota bacterium]|nr:hypothetical protein [Acidobacteriota bacterium]